MDLQPFTTVDINSSSFTETGLSNMIITGETALQQGLLNWVQSSKGDYIGTPNVGGPLDFLLGKSPTVDNANEVVSILKTQIPLRYPQFQILNCTCTPSNNQWNIFLAISDNVNKQIFQSNYVVVD